MAISGTYTGQHREGSRQGRQSEPGTDVGWENPITAAASGSCHDIHLAESLHLCISASGASPPERQILLPRENSLGSLQPPRLQGVPELSVGIWQKQ